VENVEKDWCVGSIFGNQFGFLLRFGFMIFLSSFEFGYTQGKMTLRAV
jgi:hypothetical protein